MINFPDMEHVQEPRQKGMSLAEYIEFCEFCIKNNSHITPQSCLDRKTGEEEIKAAFRI